MSDATPKKYASSDNTADILIDKLIAWNVELVFTLVGDGVNAIFEALRKRQKEIRIITVRHEEAAAFMASGYAKATGKLGVCLGTSGPGAVHLLNGLYDAAMEGAPVLAITGLVPHDLSGTRYIQEVDTVAMLKDLAVYNQQITGPVHAQTVVDLACRAALTTPGVAHIGVAADVQMKPVKEDKHSEKGAHLTGSSSVVRPVETPAGEEIEKVAALLNSSDKIMILAGRGALAAGEEVEALAQKLSAPYAKALLGKALAPDDSPLTTGGIGRLGTLASKQMMDDCEVLLILGSNMPYLEYYPKEATGIQIDRDPKAIGLRYPVQLGLVGDVKATLKALLPKLQTKSDKRFLTLAQERVMEWKKLTEKLESDASIPIQPPYLVAQISKLVKDNAHISIDTGAHTLFTARHFSIKAAQDILVCGNLVASMGPGLPYAIAAQLAFPGRQCIAMVGDGGFTMLMGELATAVLYNLPVKVIIFKNNGLILDGFEQEETGGKRYGIDLHSINFAGIAQACGAEGYTVIDPLQLTATLQKAFASDKPAVIEVDVDAEARPDPPEKLKG